MPPVEDIVYPGGFLLKSGYPGGLQGSGYPGGKVSFKMKKYYIQGVSIFIREDIQAIEHIFKSGYPEGLY